MVRSILREKSFEFFEILRYDRSDWFGFWKSFRRKNGWLYDSYLGHHQMGDEEQEERLLSLSRPFLDQLYQKNLECHRLKGKTLRAISPHIQELELERSDFTLFLVGALGIEAYTIARKQDHAMVFLDLVALEKWGKLEGLPEIALEAARKARTYMDNVERKGGGAP
ncbi:MAG TPA: hypothetical protein P5560_01875 [Thermotogota bacterium]|nr:hypothetical protein [Thermotogota bacterium]HRW91676.1 hypothetical protein [Thermotogota bacterium]